ncbi:putative tubby-like F-box protein 8-like [Capsicum annuum]|nr:putative tubby-like F-box protein 8-like [Capsicum annuum]KAF3683096.1 putative tubby-like F-box protein 8-like [Capsicum annuum]
MVLRRYQPYLAMLFIQVLYAGMALFSKASISDGMNPYVFVFYRQAFATLALAPFAIFLERITLTLDLCYVSISYISATYASASINTIPVITFILALCFRMESICYKQSHGIAKIIGTVVCVAGALVYAFVNGPPLYPESHKKIHYQTSIGTSKGEWIKGSLIMLLANTMWSLWLILQGPIMKQYPAKLRLTTLQCLFSCIQSAIWAIIVKRDVAAWKLGFNFNLLSVAYCGVLVTGLSYWLRAWVIEIKGPVFTAMFTPISLIVTAFFSSIFWKETPHLGRLGTTPVWICIWWIGYHAGTDMFMLDRVPHRYGYVYGGLGTILMVRTRRNGARAEIPEAASEPAVRCQNLTQIV